MDFLKVEAGLVYSDGSGVRALEGIVLIDIIEAVEDTLKYIIMGL